VGYVPAGLSLADAVALRAEDPAGYVAKSLEGMRAHVEALLSAKARGAVVFDYGNNLRGGAQEAGCARAFEIEGFVPAYVRPLFCLGKGLSAGSRSRATPRTSTAPTARPRPLRQRPLPRDVDPPRREKVKFQGLPARICWLGQGERAEFGLALNELVRRGEVKAPVVIGRDHLDTGSVASPWRETEAMKDGSDAIADWPILNALLNTAAGATWVSSTTGRRGHRERDPRGDGGRGRRHDGAARRLERVLTTDPGLGVVRHAEAGYDAAQAFAKRHGLGLPQGKVEA